MEKLACRSFTGFATHPAVAPCHLRDYGGDCRFRRRPLCFHDRYDAHHREYRCDVKYEPLLGVIAIGRIRRCIPVSNQSGRLFDPGFDRADDFSDMAGVLGSVYLFTALRHTLLFLLFYFVLKGYRLAPLAMQNPNRSTKAEDVPPCHCPDGDSVCTAVCSRTASAEQSSLPC